MTIIRKSTLAISLPAVFLFCTPWQPGQGLTADFASRYGCDYVDVKERAEALKERLRSGQVYTPQVGWDACDLLAHNGQPQRVEHRQTETRRSTSWWYEQSDLEGGLMDLRLVTLESRGQRWLVTYVDW